MDNLTRIHPYRARWKHLLLPALIALTTVPFSGCIFAEPCNPQEMTVSHYAFRSEELISDGLCLGEVVGRNYTFADFSYIGSTEFKDALKRSLISGGVYSSGGRYNLSVSIERETSPVRAYDVNVTESVRYCVKDTQQKKIFYEKVINSSGHASVNEAFSKDARCRIAKERAVKTNIDFFLKDLDREFFLKDLDRSFTQ